MARDPYRYFRIEARELLDQLGKGVLDMEKGQHAPDLMARLLRIAHTVKGAARVVKQGEIADLAHAIEDALAPHRDGAVMPRDRIDELLKLIDAIGVRVNALSAPLESDSAALPAGSPEESFSTMRTDLTEIDGLLSGISGTQVQVAALVRGMRMFERARHVAELLADQLASPKSQRHADKASLRVKSMAAELTRLIADLERNLLVGVDQVDRDLRQVHETAERLRLLPAGLMFNSLERTARDVARTLSKRVTFETHGGDVRLDAQVLSVIQSALVQAVRNAVAHGIEPEADRIASGKSADGHVSLEVLRRGNKVSFRCRDDGRGIDLEAVRRVAEARGMLRADVEKRSADELVTLLLAGGISTSSTVTSVSGRGVGLDVVREATHRLNGEVTVETERHKGTVFEIVVPVSLASVEALVVESGGRSVAIPIDSVRRMLRLKPADIAHSAKGSSTTFEGRVIPFTPLDRSLRTRSDRSTAAKVWSAVVVASGRSLAAVGVDRLVGTETILLRPLPSLAYADSVVAGASLDSEGNPQILLDPERLVAAAHSAGTAAPAPVATRLPILVIDDSMTTRMLEQSILESEGYAVDVAASAEEGLEKARRRRFGLFLVDVEMPGMDGFAFVATARADPVLREVPAILVTSRAGQEDRERGAACGAVGYIVKSEFDQRDLVVRIQKLVG